MPSITNGHSKFPFLYSSTICLEFLRIQKDGKSGSMYFAKDGSCFSYPGTLNLSLTNSFARAQHSATEIADVSDLNPQPIPVEGISKVVGRVGTNVSGSVPSSDSHGTM